jgi:dienelactone hydrolase
MMFSRMTICAAALVATTALASAQEEIAPPQGKGRLVMVLSGASGPEHYHKVAEVIASQGYDVLLYDGNAMAGSHGAALKAAVAAAPGIATHALPGKMGLVGFSLGGGIALGYAPGWTDSIATVVAWYPATREIANEAGWAARIAMPVLMFAGESDSYRDCCVIAKAHALADAAKSDSFTLITYPDTDHDFVINGSHYNPKSYVDAIQRTAAFLKQNLN